METTGLIRNTDFEELVLKYKRYQEARVNSLARSNQRDAIIRQIIESFEFSCSIGKPSYATMSFDEFKIIQQEIKKKANAELQKLEQSLRILGFLSFIPRWFLRRRIHDHKFQIDHGYSCLTLNYSDGFERYKKLAQVHRICSMSKLPVNFEELTEQIVESSAGSRRLISGTGYDDFHG